MKIGTLVVLADGGQGTIERVSTKTGARLYRVGDRWVLASSVRKAA